MCGITGVYASHLTDGDTRLLDAILFSQTARGPDHTGRERYAGKAASMLFGHNRLGIIDLSAQANQPMWDSTGRYCLTYNGEIYNYIELRRELAHAGFRFRTASDTEVVLNAFACWGRDAPQHFSGPFALAIYDKVAETLWLCRDRFGVRPLFYIKKKNALWFSSSTSVLAKAFHAKPDLAWLARGLRSLVYEDGSSQTAWENIVSLPAGCWLQAAFPADGKNENSEKIVCQQKRYYHLAEQVQKLIHTLPADNPHTLLELTAEKLQAAVSLRLRADVPLGVTLSSGLDSSAVAAMARQYQNQITGFSYSDPRVAKSEGPLVAACARQLGINMIHVWPSATEMAEGLFRTLRLQEAPFSGPGVVAQCLLYEQIRKQGMRVVLGGQGGDEAFMGYRKFVLFWHQHLVRQKKYRAATQHFLQFLPVMLTEITSLRTGWHHLKRYLNQGFLPPSALDLPDVPLPPAQPPGDPWMRQAADVTRFSLPTLLRYEDRNAMGNSVESRLPFLDWQLMELGIALPVVLKLHRGFGKWPIRHIMAGKLPDSIRLARFKRGFDIPVADLLRAGLGRAVRSVLHDTRSTILPFLKKERNIETLFSDRALQYRPGAMAESIALLWLGGVGT